jgi:hypothetical protein
MTTFVVLGSGPSMSQELADYVRGKCHAVAVSDCYRLAPWADALVSNDRVWWATHPQALDFAGRKFCGGVFKGTAKLPAEIGFPSDCNSGLQGMRVAAMLGATRILLLGFDMKGSHYFGAHPAPLKNTTRARFKVHLRQFRRWRGSQAVINCTPGSALTQFPFSTVDVELARVEDRSAA